MDINDTIMTVCPLDSSISLFDVMLDGMSKDLGQFTIQSAQILTACGYIG